jgi:hypothetical protein
VFVPGPVIISHVTITYALADAVAFENWTDQFSQLPPAPPLKDGSLAFLTQDLSSEEFTISFRGMRPLGKADPFGTRRSLTLSAQEFGVAVP